jgi:hypothetical protein
VFFVTARESICEFMMKQKFFTLFTGSISMNACICCVSTEKYCPKKSDHCVLFLAFYSVQFSFSAARDKINRITGPEQDCQIDLLLLLCALS